MTDRELHPPHGGAPTPEPSIPQQEAPSPAPNHPFDPTATPPSGTHAPAPSGDEGIESHNDTERGRATPGRIAKAFGLQLVARVVGLVASLATMAITTTHLGLVSYGHLTSAIVFIGLWTSLTELGIGAVVVRRVTSGTGDLQHLIRLNVGLSLAYCVPLAAAAIGTGWLIYRDTAEVPMMIAIIAGGLALTTLASCFQPLFMTDVRFGAVAVSDVGGRALSLIGTIVLVRIDADLVWFAAVQLIPPLVMLLIQGFVAHRAVGIRPVFSARQSWELIRESLPQTGVLIVAALYWRADAFLLSVLSTPAQTGAYGLAYQITSNATVISAVFLASSLSTMTNLFATDRARFAQFVQRSAEVLIFVGAPIAVVGLVLSPSLIGLLATQEFVVAGGRTLALLFIALAVTFVTAVLSQALFAAHDQVFLLRLNVVNLTGNIVLNVALIPFFGAIGAASALIVSEVIGMVVAGWRLRSRAPFQAPWGYLLRLAVPLAVATSVAIVLRHQFVLIPLTASAVAYLLTSALVGPIRLRTLMGLAKPSSGADEV
ncbi:Membrane protein involved in the export of O-antigen and teichoic acid [Tsukamurella pulmonis]|uniref:Membrane protein involved in the export of O-antigen and teichoic acid n=1 Tax=Tsukamurella pulmonis TaxID=47312 RepID=A0A1H0XZY0_9ACTN|nr:flippase [Tsukamurella pulmonis]SDQ08405.1 Membrane protein involved in the export of O-antigen and teichoic acid [Tsukamurella pulmonis]SUP12886.1 integral membrane protein MviN [Tsukamurella pulmonis]